MDVLVDPPEPSVGRHETGHDLRVELAPGLRPDLVDRLLPGPPETVRPVVGHRVDGVRDGEDPRVERSLVADEAVRIAPPVPRSPSIGIRFSSADTLRLAFGEAGRRSSAGRAHHS